MQQYMTRRLVAAQEMTYCEWPLRPGDEFLATPIDADYLLRSKRAKEAPAASVVAAPEPVQQVVEPVAAAESAIIEPASVEQEPAKAVEAVEIQSDAAADEPARPRRTYVRRNVAAK
jgi:hypothetical protein